MKAAIFALLVASASAADANPLGKVLDLLDSLYAKVVKEGEVELKAYTEYTDWCDDAANNKRNEIKTATTKKEDLEASIGKLASDISVSETKIGELAESIATQTKDLDDATL